METIEAKILAVLMRHPELKLCVLFGSGARDELRYESDVDVAVAAGTPLDCESRVLLLEELGAALGRGIDLIDLQTASPTISQQVLTTGRVIHKTSISLHASLIRRMWYLQEDEMRNYSAILDVRREHFIHG
ncbi:MAG: type VII toxin-antitoxin system MntA family adenylyltransferase antitoxin [Planctomycetota bacterium]|jgi:predicted nucleotidyltransferase